MVNSSRFGVALMGLGIHRRSFLEAAIYAARRTQWGQRIDSYPLVRETLVDMLVDLEAGMADHLRVRGGNAQRRRRGRGPARPPDPHPTGQDAQHSRRRCGRHRTRSRSSGATATCTTGRSPASCATRSATPSGRAPRTSWPSTCGGPSGASSAHLALCTPASTAPSTPPRPSDLLAGSVDVIARTRKEVWDAIDVLAGAPEDVALLQSRRLAELLADTAEGALLVEEAARGLTHDNDARKAAGRETLRRPTACRAAAAGPFGRGPRRARPIRTAYPLRADRSRQRLRA